MKEKQFTTGQLSGITRISYISLYRYVRNYPEFFSDGVRRHRRGRRWNPSDLAMVQAIRYLLHERKSKAEVKQILRDGFKLQLDSTFTVEAFSRLFEATLALADHSEKLVHDAQRAIDDVKFLHTLTIEQRVQIADMSTKVRQLEHEVSNQKLRIDNIKKRRFDYV